jgi:hypothetical protein
LSEEKRRGFAERGRQVALAEARHEVHIGAVMPVRANDATPTETQ